MNASAVAWMLGAGWGVVLAAPLAIAVNIVRVAGTALIADYNQEFAEGFYHSFSGWLIFVAGFGILYLFARILHAAQHFRVSRCGYARELGLIPCPASCKLNEWAPMPRVPVPPRG